MNFQNVANIIWASATVGHPISPKAMERLIKAAVADVGNATPLSLVNLLVASAKLGVSSEAHKSLVLSCVRQVRPMH